jgi:prophage regulatory protein
MSFEFKYLTEKEVCKAVGLHRMTIYRLMKIGRFPRPMKIGIRKIAWLEEDLREWIEQRKRER